MSLDTRNQFAIAGPLSAMGAMVFFSINDMVFKLFSETYALHLLVFVRCTIAFAIILFGVLVFGDGFRSLKTRRPIAHIIRGMLVVLANMSFFLGVAALPLADTVAIFFISPLLITIFSVVFLRETVGPFRWVAIGVGFMGVMLIIRPGSDAFQMASLLPVFAATCYAGLNIMTRILGRTDSTPALAFYVQIVFIVVAVGIGIAIGDGRYADSFDNPSAAFFFRAWEWPSVGDYPWFLVLGICVGFGAYLISAAYRMSEAALVAPVEYVAMPLAIILGILFFDDWPDAIASAGMVLIVGSGLFMLWRESRSGKVSAAPVARSRR